MYNPFAGWFSLTHQGVRKLPAEIFEAQEQSLTMQKKREGYLYPLPPHIGTNDFGPPSIIRDRPFLPAHCPEVSQQYL